MSRPSFDSSNPTHEAQHWTSLSLTHARRLAKEHFMDSELKNNPELVIEIAKIIMGFVTAKETQSDEVGMQDIASAVRDIQT